MFSKLMHRSTQLSSTHSRRRGLFVERLEPRALLTATGFYVSGEPQDLRLFEFNSHADRSAPMMDVSRLEFRSGTLFTNTSSAGNGSGWLVRSGGFDGDAPAINRTPSFTRIEIRTLPAMGAPMGGDFGNHSGNIQISLPGSFLQNQLRADAGETLPHEPGPLVAGIENAAAIRPNNLGSIFTGLNGNSANGSSPIDGSGFTANSVSSPHGSPTNFSLSTEASSNDGGWTDSWSREELERLRLQREETSDEGGYISLEASIDSDLPWATATGRSVASKDRPILVARFNEDGTLRAKTKSEHPGLAQFRPRELPEAAMFGSRPVDEVFADEGGMIAMVADASSYDISGAADEPNGGPLPISIDRAIGLFLNVELASSPDENDILLPLAPIQPQESPKLPAAPEPTVYSEQATAPETELQTAILSRAAGVPIMAGAVFSLLSTSTSQREVKQLPRKPR